MSIELKQVAKKLKNLCSTSKDSAVSNDVLSQLSDKVKKR
jgi:hypothetical protein